MKQLTDEQLVRCIEAAGFKTWDSRMWPLMRGIVTEFCRINGITGEAQSAEQANGPEAVAKIERRFGGVRIVAPNGEPFDMARFVGSTLYTTPPARPSREWVGLTDDDIFKIRIETQGVTIPFARAIESASREKNAGLPATMNIEELAQRLLRGEKWHLSEGVTVSVEQPAAVPDENRCIRELREYAEKNPGTYIFPGWDGNRVTKYLAAAPRPQDDLPAILKKQAS